MFESNSSSMHVIVIGKDNEPHDKWSTLGQIIGDDEVVGKRLVYDDIQIEEDGYPLMSWVDKLGYVLAWGLGCNNCADEDDRQNFMNKMLMMVQSEHPEIERIVIKNYKDLVDEDRYGFWGLINHQSIDLIKEFKANTIYGLKDIVFNNNIVIVPVWDGNSIQQVVSSAEAHGLKNPAEAYTEWGQYTKEDWEKEE